MELLQIINEVMGTVYYVANFVTQGRNEGKVSGAILMGTTEYRFVWNQLNIRISSFD